MTGSVPRCPWCSAQLPIPGAERCPSCDAALVTTSGTDPDIKGVTTLDTEAILRARADVARPRSSFLSFLTGDATEAASAREHQESLAEPSNAVKREMLRLELDAKQRELVAENVALKAEAMTELGIHVHDLEAAEAAELAQAHEGIQASEAPPVAPAPIDDVEDPPTA